MIYQEYNLKPKKGEAILLPIGDIHYGSKYCDVESLEKTLLWALSNENVYLISMGDEIEASTKTSVGAGVFEQSITPQEQYERIFTLYESFAKQGRLLGILDSNHNQRIYKHSGFNVSKTLAKALGVKFLGFSAALKLKVGKQNYSVYATHGSSGSKLPHTKIKAVTDIGKFIACDIVLYGHVHDLRSIKMPYYVFNYKRKMFEEIMRYYILTGSYVKYDGSYAEMKNMPPAVIGTPIIHLGALERKISVEI